MSQVREFTVPARYNGPPGSAQGGYLCGGLAALAAPAQGSTAAVTLLAPAPLDTAMEFRPGQRRSGLWHGEELVATVTTVATGSIPVVDPVSAEIAADCAGRFLGRRGHPFPTCFACGPDRVDGLRLAPGPVRGRDAVVACRWTPRDHGAGEVPAEVVWSVLDCPGGWTVDPRPSPMVLSRMVAELHSPVWTNESYVVVARRDTEHGRTSVNLTALYDAAGVLVASATALWTAVDRG
ncbi:hypothetical protein F0L68_29855 [Solihabitans fulvus]|uniref:Thioesterase family protein n=1 Tax=Solihabitans fulvus TaxID=1892852 RepID=A0A5B2WUG6_9PSEU|nr:hypothetical protein [Solihabitans fulvus]KAA2254638.1 hypothetical protein F0L68_29855 [Solihabitans fulvus]